MAGALKRLMAAGEREQGENIDLTGYTLLVSSLFSSPASIIPGGIAGILTPFLCWLSTGMDIFMSLTVLVTLIVICAS